MTTSAVVNGQFVPEFAAYTKLTLVNRFQNEMKGFSSLSQSKNSMTFEQFMNALENNKPVHQSLARHTSPEEVADNITYQQQNGASIFARERFEAIQKAYHLGLVDLDGVLSI
ncbi:hypothetical protein [Paenibacillus azoreducens]|uniref:Uncharacterized protein n=1 Tax=Paenibacillus azoreducens TaxID=116718 RepID=A0A920CT78_9BACL|nr:hypothetical protein [Paenibacillus azoreducens]GIO48924.1 hypothetical protein J34TS1_36890 [Paenibacillus azoreducens]